MLGRPTLSVQQTPEGSLLARWEPPAGATEDEVLGYRLQFGREDLWTGARQAPLSMGTNHGFSSVQSLSRVQLFVTP